jgi:hypothetical protein
MTWLAVEHSIDSRFTAGSFVLHGGLKNHPVVNNPFVVVEEYLRNYTWPECCG